MYSPGLSYRCTGFCSEDFVPSPKVHSHEVGLPVERSVNITSTGVVPERGVAEKSASGMDEGGVVGTVVGMVVGIVVGMVVGMVVGIVVGTVVGIVVGIIVGSSVGVGVAVGSSEVTVI